eukprot:gene20340-65507_t
MSVVQGSVVPGQAGGDPWGKGKGPPPDMWGKDGKGKDGKGKGWGGEEHGVVKRWDDEKAYGFIRCDAGDELFVHAKSWEREGRGGSKGEK